MNRTKKEFSIENIDDFVQRAIIWSAQFREVVVLDSNNHHLPHHTFSKLLAFDALTSIQSGDIQQIQEYQSQLRDWCFGFITYDVKNAIEEQTSLNPDYLHFPDIVFFQPKRLISINEDAKVVFEYLALCEDEIDSDFNEIVATNISTKFVDKPIELTPRVTSEKYKKQFSKAIDYIKRGDTYELNYCIEFYNNDTELNPYVFYNQLNNKSKSSFAAFVKFGHLFALCASPERYLKKNNDVVISQPIKGTAARGKTYKEDEKQKSDLLNSTKERAENIMIVDLVRNDLSKIANKNSVEVNELCGIYTFEHVHQMISTVSCKVSNDTQPMDVISNTFPMGSMTGAPKKRTMEIIEEIEDHKRGLYSGTIGYFTPTQDFDFNVVIRTLLYNQKEKYASLSVGSAITFLAEAEKEYEECLLKSKAIRDLLLQK